VFRAQELREHRQHEEIGFRIHQACRRTPPERHPGRRFCGDPVVETESGFGSPQRNPDPGDVERAAQQQRVEHARYTFSNTLMPSVVIATWPMPPATMPATAANPCRRPAVSELPITKAMSRPGSTTMPNTSTANSNRSAEWLMAWVLYLRRV